MTYSEVIWLGYKGERFTVEFGQKSEEIFAGEGPLKGRGAALIVGLEGKQTLLEFGQRREIVGGENFSLNSREIDFDLIEPTGVDRGVDQNGVRPFGAETVGRLLPAMSGTIVHDPEDAMGGLVGRLTHDLAHQAVHRSNAVFDFAAAEDFGTMHVPRSQVGPGALAKVLVLDARRASGSRRQSWLFAAAGLNAGLFIGRDHEVSGAQGSAVANALIEVKDATGLGRKVGIARENPAAVLPRAEGIAAEPAPQGSAADLCD